MLSFSQGSQAVNPKNFPWSDLGGDSLPNLNYLGYTGVAKPQGFFEGLFEGMVYLKISFFLPLGISLRFSKIKCPKVK